MKDPGGHGHCKFLPFLMMLGSFLFKSIATAIIVEIFGVTVGRLWQLRIPVWLALMPFRLPASEWVRYQQ